MAGTPAVTINLRCTDTHTHTYTDTQLGDACTRENQTAPIKRRNKNIFLFSAPSLLPFLILPCSLPSPEPCSPFSNTSPSFQPHFLSQFVLLLLFLSPIPPSLFHSALLIPPTIFSLQPPCRGAIWIGRGGGVFVSVCACVFGPEIACVCVCRSVFVRVCEIGEGQERGREERG